MNPTTAVPSTMGRLIVRHTAAAPAVDVLAGGTAVISGLTSPNEKALMVPAGTASASVTGVAAGSGGQAADSSAPMLGIALTRAGLPLVGGVAVRARRLVAVRA